MTTSPNNLDELVEALAKKLFGYHKASLEEQDVIYATWDTVNSRSKRAWLDTAEAFLKGLA